MWRAALSALTPPPGRMERLVGGNGEPLVVVDYAHTPDALENVLRALRGVARRAMAACVSSSAAVAIATKGKRPQMGEVAARLADRVW
jgi:murE/murF fusion protein